MIVNFNDVLDTGLYAPEGMRRYDGYNVNGNVVLVSKNEC